MNKKIKAHSKTQLRLKTLYEHGTLSIALLSSIIVLAFSLPLSTTITLSFTQLPLDRLKSSLTFLYLEVLRMVLQN